MRRTQEPRGATDAETLTRPISLHKGPGNATWAATFNSRTAFAHARRQ
jgi:hypothetical protein